MSIVLMYHAILENELLAETCDPHYAINTQEFAKHVELIMSNSLSIRSLKEKLNGCGGKNESCVYFTFDDGHVSNYEAALKLGSLGHKADFFINPTLIGDKNLMSWDQIIELSRIGMSIQSHGLTHNFFDDMSHKTVLSELEKSKKIIEDKISDIVEIFAPPGGRINNYVRNSAFDLGYKMICTSVPGKNLSDYKNINRISVKKSTSLKLLNQYIVEKNSVLMPLKMKYHLLNSLKIILGNKLYTNLRSGVLKT